LDEWGYAPLHYAVSHNDVAMVKFLLAIKDINVNILDKYDWVPLCWAVSEQVVSLLLNQGHAQINFRDYQQRTPLIQGAIENNRALVQALLKYGAEVDLSDEGKWTALHWASEYGFIDIVRSLVAYNADINKLDSNNWTPLHFAVENGRLEVAEYLISLPGIELDAKDNKGQTPLDLALKSTLKDSGAIVKALRNGSECKCLETGNLQVLVLQNIKMILKAAAQIKTRQKIEKNNKKLLARAVKKERYSKKKAKRLPEGFERKTLGLRKTTQN
jgi:ankyrin repeat protein